MFLDSLIDRSIVFRDKTINIEILKSYPLLIVLRPVTVVLWIVVIVSPVLLGAVIISLLVLRILLIIMGRAVTPRPWTRHHWKLTGSCTLVSSLIVRTPVT